MKTKIDGKEYEVMDFDPVKAKEQGVIVATKRGEHLSEWHHFTSVEGRGDKIAGVRDPKHGIQHWREDGCYVDKLNHSNNDLQLLIPSPWQLPPPPEGREWMRASEWTQDMLPDGMRPLLADEKAVARIDECIHDKSEGGWEPAEGISGFAANQIKRYLVRTARPVPTLKRLPLTAEDFPYGTCMQATGWPKFAYTPCRVNPLGEIIIAGHGVHSLEGLSRSDWLKKSPAAASFVPCFKEVWE